MSTTVVKGTDVCLFIGTALAKKVIAHATSCKISIAASTTKVTSKDSGKWEESIVQRFNWNVDSEQFKSVGVDADRLTFDDMVTSMLAGVPITVTVGEVTGAMPQVLGVGKSFVGTAIITKFDTDGKDGDAATYSVSMEGTGELTHV
jgi:predicted secreted protein